MDDSKAALCQDFINKAVPFFPAGSVMTAIVQFNDDVRCQLIIAEHKVYVLRLDFIKKGPVIWMILHRL